MTAIELAFEEFGSSVDEPLIILHGFLASARNWRHVAKKLAAGHHVYALDIRNHGLSPHNPLMDYPSMANDLLLFLKQRNLKKVSLLGHSMGGKIAMWFALNHPKHLDKLIIADIAPVNYSHSFDAMIKALISLPLSTISNRKQAEIMLAPAIPELSYRQFLLQNLVLQDGHYQWRIDLDIFYEMAPNIAAFPDSGLLEPYQGKTLFIAGNDSNFVSVEDIKAPFPLAQMKIIPNAGHWLHVQQPTAFIDMVEKFLQQS
jgi:esterase